MSNTTITALPAVTNAVLTDVFPVDQSGTTKKESLQKVLQLFGTGLTTVYVNPSVGSNTTGNGSALNPYASITFANSVITDNTSSKRYCILLQGNTTETAVTIKPFVSIFGCDPISSFINISPAGSVTLDSTWNSTTNPKVSLSNLTISAGTNFDSHLNVLGASNIEMINCILLGNNVWRGATSSAAIGLTSCSTVGTVTATDLDIYSALSFYTGGVSFISTNAISAMTWNSQADSISLFPFAISETSTKLTQFIASGTSINTSVSVTGATATFIFDSVSYPRSGITFASSGSASTFLGCPNSVPVTAVTGATYTALKSDYILSCNRAGAITITLPATVSKNTWVVKDASGAAATFNITVDGNGHNIDGGSTYVLANNWGSFTINGDTTNNIWLIT